MQDFVAPITYGVLILVVLGFVYAMLNVLREYERGVVFMLGRFYKVKGPGLIIVIPIVQQMVRVDLRIRVLDVQPQDVISKDNVSVKVNAVVYFRVVDSQKAIIQVENFLEATSQLAQTTLRSVLGRHELDEMLSERDKLNADIQRILDEQTDPWGIKVSNVELKHVDLNESMIRAIAKQAEAERGPGRAAGGGQVPGGRADPVATGRGHATALSHDAARHRRRTKLHHRISAADRPGQGTRGGLRPKRR
jgi:regulator of protease activity HflC (stomatin/prohibitin superfamily)